MGSWGALMGALWVPWRQVGVVALGGHSGAM